jgi:hypothetical protein
MRLDKFTEFYKKWFSIYPKSAQKFRTIAISESFVKQNSDSNGNCKYVHEPLLQET